MTPPSQAEAVRVSTWALVGWLVPVALGLGLIGAVPTYLVAGKGGLAAELAAGGSVMTVMLANALAVRKYTAYGPRVAAFAFMLSGLARVAVCIGLTAGLWSIFNLPGRVLLAWTGLFYLSLMIAEAMWLARALLEDDFRTNLGEIRSPKPLMPSDLPGASKEQG